MWTGALGDLEVDNKAGASSDWVTVKVGGTIPVDRCSWGT